MGGTTDTGLWGTAIGTAALAVMAAVVLTWPVSSLLLTLYRRSVANGMRRAATPPPIPTGAGPLDEPAVSARATRSGSRIEVVATEMSADQFLVARARARARRAQVVFAIAGLSFGIVSSLAYFKVSGTQSTIRQVVTLTPLLAWLTVPTLLAIGVQDRRSRTRFVCGYLGLVFLTLMLYGGVPFEHVLALLLVSVLLPAVLISASGVRSVRGAAWLVAPSLVLLALAAQVAYLVSALVPNGLLLDGIGVLLLAMAGVLPLVGIGYGWGIARLHSSGWASDETLRMAQWWFFLAVFQTLFLGVDGLAAALLGLLPIVALGVVLAVAALRFRPLPEPPVRLLLLRTFGARRRSAQLFRDLAMRWRWIGSVELIAGTDLASETVEPDAFLTFLRGRLSRSFVRCPQEARQAVEALSTSPARDGRYGIHELLCHDDTWQAVLRALIERVDAVLIDLRDLTVHRTGVQHELEQLVALVPLQSVIAIVDGTTDADVLRTMLDRAVTGAPPEAPIWGETRPLLRVVRVGGHRTADAELVFNAIATAASGLARRAYSEPLREGWPGGGASYRGR
jgi:hypothetical protein